MHIQYNVYTRACLSIRTCVWHQQGSVQTRQCSSREIIILLAVGGRAETLIHRQENAKLNLGFPRCKMNSK